MTTTREIYWIIAEPQAAVWEKISTLHKFHIEARVLPDFQALARAYSQNRLNTIIVTPHGPPASYTERLLRICQHPEYAGVRFLLAVEQADPDLIELAVKLGFRDILSLDLSTTAWIRRYIFATAGHTTDLTNSSYQLTCRHLAAAYIPARISWISEEALWLETRLSVPVGTKINIQGGITQELGLKHLTLEVLERSNTHLHYRYSEALLCRWDVPGHSRRSMQTLLHSLRPSDQGIPLRMYVVIRTPTLRRSFMKGLDPQRFQVAVALNKINMVQEPRYISPDLIVIEDKMCMGSHRSTFLAMLDNLQSSTRVLIISQNSSPEHWPPSHPRATIDVIPPNLEDFEARVGALLGSQRSAQPGAVLIPKHNPASFAQIVLSARLIRIHPQTLQVALQYPLGRYGICSIETPLLQSTFRRRLHMKVVHTVEASQATIQDFPYEIDAIWIDLSTAESHRLAEALIKLYTEKMGVSESPPRLPQATSERVSEPVISLAPISRVSTKAASPSEWSINPSAEDHAAVPTTDPEPDSPSGIALEWKLAILTLLVFAALFGLILLLRSPQEDLGRPFIEPLRKFKEQRGGSLQPTPPS